MQLAKVVLNPPELFSEGSLIGFIGADHVANDLRNRSAFGCDARARVHVNWFALFEERTDFSRRIIDIEKRSVLISTRALYDTLGRGEKANDDSLLLE